MSALSNALTGKSKTINLNAAGVALVPLLQAFGIMLDPTMVAAGFTLLNWILRSVTKKPLADK